ncbi:hypothetical protein NM75689_1059 [Neisseria meningitidis 75689]|nr:hypothetical protein NM75689_2103 [Neisseria meningitidis 75689]EOB51947.1 hypothetical protein NM75689_1946 [Neisseria meningitidis 75689]EOB52815.1 hypothetical protein NM75689_1594 [Neisseria meningitidis 75689]EOB53840.1 hypothetical protein NM75689_1276 [Neisseria meningitidis 75689]EOB54127.1 hypothetical protein NM75689_1116 [Neisseria meningitidis 75689]
MSYTQLTQGERYHIQYLSPLHRHRNRQTAEPPQKHHQPRNQTAPHPRAAIQRRKSPAAKPTIKQRKRQPYKLDSQLIQHIDTLIRRKLSPEQVCAYLANTTDHAPPQHHLPLPSPRQKQRQHVVATSQNMQQTLPQTLRQHMDQRQSPNRVGIENRPAIVDQNPVSAIGKPTPLSAKDRKAHY